MREGEPTHTHTHRHTDNDARSVFGQTFDEDFIGQVLHSEQTHRHIHTGTYRTR